MNKLILGAAIFSLSMLANAQSVDLTVSASKDVSATESVNIRADKSGLNLYKTGCITETGTRIKHRAKDKYGCNGFAGRSYDRDDIDRTGAFTAGEALEHLDPSIQISR